MTLSAEGYESVTCLNGHVALLPHDEIRQMTGVFRPVEQQLADIDAGKKLDAVIVSSHDCPVCKDDRERQERLYEESDFGLFERTSG